MGKRLDALIYSIVAGMYMWSPIIALILAKIAGYQISYTVYVASGAGLIATTFTTFFWLIGVLYEKVNKNARDAYSR